MATEKPQRLIDNMRGVRYGEVLAMFLRDTGLEAEVYGTQMLNDCPQEQWQTLDADAIAKEMGAVFAKLNGPRHWLLDGLGTKVAVVEPVFRDFNGITMRRIATISFGADFSPGSYIERKINRGAVFFWDAGKKVYDQSRCRLFTRFICRAQNQSWGSVLLGRRQKGLRAGQPRWCGVCDAGTLHWHRPNNQ